MSLRSGTVFYWFCIGVAALLVLVAVLWNGWTFNQYSRAQGQLNALGVDVSESPAAEPRCPRHGSYVEENFLGLLAEPQKRALAVARRDRLNDRVGERKTSLIFGVILLLGGAVIFGVARRYRRGA